MAGVEKDEVVVRVGDVYVVGVLDDWYVVPPDAVRRFLAKLLNVKEEDISLKC
jgi:predicted RecB family endonuclease